MNQFAMPDEKNPENKKKNKGVVCDVKNCIYNDKSCHCTAEKITVGPTYATCCSDTVCATFKQRTFD